MYILTLQKEGEMYMQVQIIANKWSISADIVWNQNFHIKGDKQISTVYHPLSSSKISNLTFHFKHQSKDKNVYILPLSVRTLLSFE